MNPYWEAIAHLLQASRQYRHDPSPANRQIFYRALEDVKRLELERAGDPLPARDPAVSPTPTYGDRQLTRERSRPQRRMSSVGLVSFMLSIVLIAVLGISLIDKTRQQQLAQARESTLEFKVTELFLTAQAAEATLALTPSESFVCGGDSRTPRQPGTFLRSLGLTSYTVEQDSVGLRADAVRALAIDERGIWAGHNLPQATTPGADLIQFDRQTWEHCGAQLTNLHVINEIMIDRSGRVWVATGNSGVFVWDGERWQNFTTHDGLPDNNVYTTVQDADGNIWAGTWQGIAIYDGAAWTVPYSISQRDTLADNHVHSLAFHPSGELWVGYVDAGVSRLTAEGEWLHYTAEQNPDVLQDDNIRALVVDNDGDIWIGTDGGGISRYNFDDEQWQQYTTSIGALADNHVYDLALDPAGRIWAAASGATSYFDGSEWRVYSPVDATVIAFGIDCSDCPYNEDHVWLGTRELGLTHSRLPATSPVVEVISVFYPRVVTPGQSFPVRIRVRTLPDYELRDDRGDGLFYTGATDEDRFGAWPIIPVRGVVDGGKTYEFYDYENPFVAPDKPGNYLSTWRVWQAGRYVGPEIRIEFRVAGPEETVEAPTEEATDVAVTDQP